MPVSPRGISLLTSLLFGAPLAAEVVTLHPIADTSLFEFDPDVNFGRQRDLPAGVLGLMGDSARARVLYRYNLAGEVPEGAVLDSARMKLSISSQIPETGRRASDFALSRVRVDWGEGDGFGERPGGRDAEPGEATWNFRFHPEPGEAGTSWSEPGGQFGVDFEMAESAAASNVDGSEESPTTYFFQFSPAGLAELREMIDGTLPNYGWVLYTLAESTRKTARRWTSREALSEGPRPELELSYSMPGLPNPPELTSVAIDPGTGELCVRLNGRLGFCYQLERGDDLTTWAPGERKVPEEDGELVFRLPLDGSAKFVRIRRDIVEDGGKP